MAETDSQPRNNSKQNGQRQGAQHAVRQPALRRTLDRTVHHLYLALIMGMEMPKKTQKIG